MSSLVESSLSTNLNLQKSNSLEVSAALLKAHSLKWLSEMKATSVLVGGILSIMHPELFATGIRCITELGQNYNDISKGSNLPEILESWGSPFNVISAIYNRNTPFHRDNGSAYPWYDILMPMGRYEDGRAEFPGLGLRLEYSPGSLVGHLGKVLRHGTKCSGNHACIAFYMREAVVKEMEIPVGTWMTVAEYD